MKRNQIACGLIAMLAIAMPVVAEDFVDPGEAFDQAYAAYKSELNARFAWSIQAIEAHTEAVIDAFAVENGNAIVECAAGTLVWNSSLGHVELWYDDEEVTLSRSSDDRGRLTFAGTNLTGFVDIDAADHVWIEMVHNNVQSIWTGVVERNPATNNIISVPAMEVETRCICKGTAGGCGWLHACDVEDGCSYTDSQGNSHDSTCKRKKVVV